MGNVGVMPIQTMAVSEKQIFDGEHASVTDLPGSKSKSRENTLFPLSDTPTT
jgi:hypothetical protein